MRVMSLKMLTNRLCHDYFSYDALEALHTGLSLALSGIRIPHALTPPPKHLSKAMMSPRHGGKQLDGARRRFSERGPT